MMNLKNNGEPGNKGETVVGRNVFYKIPSILQKFWILILFLNVVYSFKKLNVLIIFFFGSFSLHLKFRQSDSCHF